MMRNPSGLSANKFGLSLQNFYRVERWGRGKEDNGLPFFERSYLSQYLPHSEWENEMMEIIIQYLLVSMVPHWLADHDLGCFPSFKHILIISKTSKTDLLPETWDLWTSHPKTWDWNRENSRQKPCDRVQLLWMGCLAKGTYQSWAGIWVW